MTIVFLVLGVVVVAAIALLAVGRLGELPPAEPDRPPTLLPDTRLVERCARRGTTDGRSLHEEGIDGGRRIGQQPPPCRRLAPVGSEVTGVEEASLIGLDEKCVSIEAAVVDQVGRNEKWAHLEWASILEMTGERAPKGGLRKGARGADDRVCATAHVERYIHGEILDEAEMVKVAVRHHHAHE